MKQLFSCDLVQKNFFGLTSHFLEHFIFIQKDPISDGYPISDGALFSNHSVTIGYHMFTFYSLGLICVIFHVLTYFLNICHVVDKFRLFARKSKIAKFQYFQKITQLQLKTCAIILFVSFFEQRKMFELNGPPKKHFWCSNMFLKSTSTFEDPISDVRNRVFE